MTIQNSIYKFIDAVLRKLTRFESRTFGEGGHRWIEAAGSSPAGEYYDVIYVTVDSTISYTSVAQGGDSTITSKNVFAGTSIYGQTTSVSVTAGQVLAYIKL